MLTLIIIGNGWYLDISGACIEGIDQQSLIDGDLTILYKVNPLQMVVQLLNLLIGMIVQM